MLNYGPYQRRFYMIVLRLLAMIARNTYKGQYSSFDATTLFAADRLHDEIFNGRLLTKPHRSRK